MTSLDPAKILLTGGSGLLGRTLRQIAPELVAPTHDEFDLTDSPQMEQWLAKHAPHTVLHAAAFTSPPLVDQNPMAAAAINITGTAELARLCSAGQLRLVYISTDYVFKGDRGRYTEQDELLPQNLYAWSKLGGECAARMYPRSLIIRTSFCEPEFPYDKAFVDQYTSRDSVTVIAPLILRLTLTPDLLGTVHVGTDRKTVRELAIKLGKTDVGDLYRDDMSFNVPFDTSFNLKKLQSILAQDKS